MVKQTSHGKTPVGVRAKTFARGLTPVGRGRGSQILAGARPLQGKGPFFLGSSIGRGQGQISAEMTKFDWCRTLTGVNPRSRRNKRIFVLWMRKSLLIVGYIFRGPVSYPGLTPLPAGSIPIGVRVQITSQG